VGAKRWAEFRLELASGWLVEVEPKHLSFRPVVFVRSAILDVRLTALKCGGRPPRFHRRLEAPNKSSGRVSCRLDFRTRLHRPARFIDNEVGCVLAPGSNHIAPALTERLDRAALQYMRIRTLTKKSKMSLKGPFCSSFVSIAIDV